MIIYYHCTRDSALLLSFFTNLPSLLPLSFHEMIFILVPPVFFRANALVRATKNVITGSTGTRSQSRIAHAQQKINHAYVCQWRLV